MRCVLEKSRMVDFTMTDLFSYGTKQPITIILYFKWKKGCLVTKGVQGLQHVLSRRLYCIINAPKKPTILTNTLEFKNSQAALLVVKGIGQTMLCTILKLSKCQFLSDNGFVISKQYAAYLFYISQSYVLLTANSKVLSYYLIETKVAIVGRQKYYALSWHQCDTIPQLTALPTIIITKCCHSFIL